MSVVRHVIETDLEPDDVVAIVSHASLHKDVHLSIIVGEGDARIKVCIARALMKHIQKAFPKAYASVEIIQGLSTETNYPTLLLDKEWFTDMPEAKSEESILAEYRNTYKWGVDVAYMMKPPREMLISAAQLDLSKTTAFAYGGFNWRTTHAHVTVLNDMAKAFEQFFYTFRFTALGEDTIYVANFSKTPLSQAISQIVYNWNCHLYAKAMATIEAGQTLGDMENGRTSGIDQAKGIVASIKGREGTQFVMADVITTMVDLPDVAVRLVAFDKEAIWEPDATSTIYIHDKEGMDARRSKLIWELDNLLKAI